MSLNHKMGEKHEADLVDALGGRATRGSGNQAHDPMDGKHSVIDRDFGWAWDGKSTRARSLGLTREMWEKAVDQAYDRRPIIAARFYDDDRLRHFLDLIILSLDDFVELIEAVDSRSRDEWLREGINRGWCSEGFCNTHDMAPVTDGERLRFDEGHDPCTPSVRIWQ